MKNFVEIEGEMIRQRILKKILTRANSITQIFMINRKIRPAGFFNCN